MIRTEKICFIFFIAALFSACLSQPDTGEDANVSTKGSIEVTAKLVEIKGEIRDDPLYNYAHIFKYQILQHHRGEVKDEFIYVGHYNPAKTRDSVADARSGEIGGNVKRFKVGDVHRMALEVPIDDHFMGGIINEYFDTYDGPIYWAVWTNRV